MKVALSQTQGAQLLLKNHFKGTYPEGNTPAKPVHGVSPTAEAFVICGECSDDGGGSSGQCACDKG